MLRLLMLILILEVGMMLLVLFGRIVRVFLDPGLMLSSIIFICCFVVQSQKSTGMLCTVTCTVVTIMFLKFKMAQRMNHFRSINSSRNRPKMDTKSCVHFTLSSKGKTLKSVFMYNRRNCIVRKNTL